MQDKIKSKCCGADLEVSTADEGTSCYICKACKMPTDPGTTMQDKIKECHCSMCGAYLTYDEVAGHKCQQDNGLEEGRNVNEAYTYNHGYVKCPHCDMYIHQIMAKERKLGVIQGLSQNGNITYEPPEEQAFRRGVAAEKAKWEESVAKLTVNLPVFLMQDGVSYDWLQKEAYLQALTDLLNSRKGEEK